MIAICVTTVTQMTLSQNDFKAVYQPRQIVLTLFFPSTQNNLMLQFAENLFKTIPIKNFVLLPKISRYVLFDKKNLS